MKPIIKRITQITVLPEGEPIFSDRAFNVTLADEAAGEFLRVTSLMDEGNITVEYEEWEMLRFVIDKMFDEIKKHKPEDKE